MSYSKRLNKSTQALTCSQCLWALDGMLERFIGVIEKLRPWVEFETLKTIDVNSSDCHRNYKAELLGSLQLVKINVVTLGCSK